jgi:hypothetical protein
MKLPPLHPFSRRYLLPGQKPNNPNHRLIISLDPEINLQSLFDGSLFEGLGKRQSLASFLKLVEATLTRAARDWASEIHGGTGFGSDEDPCVNRDQPEGRLLEEEEINGIHKQEKETEGRISTKPSIEPDLEYFREKDGINFSDESKKSVNDTCRGWRMEKLAWYSDAHRHEIIDYGIHIKRGAVAKILPRLESFLNAKSTPQDRRILMFSILFKIYAHERCHGWVEDISSLTDFLHEENEADRRKRRYARTLNRLRAYIFLEEALCNTAAHGLLYHQLHKVDELRGIGLVGDLIPDFDPSEIMDAFRDWMRSQPAGYRDFSEITERPQESSLFKANLVRLLTDRRIYGYEQDPIVIRDLVEGYFQSPDASSLDLHRYLNGFRCTPAVYLEGIDDNVVCEVKAAEKYNGKEINDYFGVDLDAF